MLSRIWTLWIILCLSQTVFCQFHEDVYPGESGAQLITKLRLEFRPDEVLSYRDARELMYAELYNEDDSVTCVYSNFSLYLDPDSPDPIGDLIQNNNPDGINCEHTFPQSRGAGSGNPRSDMHHLFPTRAAVNSARLNYPFDEIDDRNTAVWYIEDREQTSIPVKNIDDYSELGNEEFEPREDHKGNVARAMFYFYTVYRSVADASFFSGQRSTLCAWHYLDPVDEKEWENNMVIATYQGNKRNPFILDCSLAGRTYCPDVSGDCNTTSNDDLNTGILRIYPNPALDGVMVEIDDSWPGGEVQISDLAGRKLVSYRVSPSKTEIYIPVGKLAAGTYFLQLRTDERSVFYHPITFTVK